MKAHIEAVLRRYSYIQTALKEGKTEATFYVGNRKQKIIIDTTLKIIFAIIEDIAKQEKDIYIKMMIEGIKKGDSDKYIMTHLPMEKNAYYDRKKKFIDKIYKCCICKGLVSYEEILNESIG